jgi:hypothetical protein
MQARSKTSEVRPGAPPVGLRGRSHASATTADSRRGQNWLFEPKTAIWIVLLAALAGGGGRKLLATWRARRGVARLATPNVSPEEIEGVADFGRAGVWELLRIFSEAGTNPEQRAAAGRALARLWRNDELVAEEEQAIVRRGFAVSWKARRRYPRLLQCEIPISVAYDVPFLRDDGRGVGPDNLEWSHRVLGARRVALETFSAWKPGRGRLAFSIVPGDFETSGPHRLVLQTRVRTTGLSSRWEIELPHIPFVFEFDPNLQIDSIITLPDAGRGEMISRAIGLVPSPSNNGEPSRYLIIGEEWALRNPPNLAVTMPLRCDLAHAISIEIEGIADRLAAGQFVVCGQPMQRPAPADSRPQVEQFDLQPAGSLPRHAIERPGIRRMRVVLEADPSYGWAEPDVRSIWPGRIETAWVEVEIVRR